MYLSVRFYIVFGIRVSAGSHDAHGLGQLAAHQRVVSEKFRRVDGSPADAGVFHHVQMA